MTLDELITTDPETVGGTPVFRGTRVPVAILFEELAAGASLDDVLADYPTVARADAEAVLRLAGEVVGLRAGRRAA